VCDEDCATHNNGTNEVDEVMKQQESTKHIKVKNESELKRKRIK
jgi:hypothetical protein